MLIKQQRKKQIKSRIIFNIVYRFDLWQIITNKLEEEEGESHNYIPKYLYALENIYHLKTKVLS